MSRKRDIVTALLGITTAVIFWITILSREELIGTPIKYQPFHALASFVKEIHKGRLGANFIGNILLFMPIGVLLPLVTGKKKWLWTVVAGGGLSLFIEITQLITSRGCFDPDDVMLNITGTAIGFGLYRYLMRYFE